MHRAYFTGGKLFPVGVKSGRIRDERKTQCATCALSLSPLQEPHSVCMKRDFVALYAAGMRRNLDADPHTARADPFTGTHVPLTA